MTELAPSTGHAMPWVTIIIVNYNAGRFLQPALDAVAAQTNKQYELILLDNNSTDGSLDELNTDGISDFKLIKLDENVGFAKGNNLAAKQARGDWIVLLNPDTEAFPDWLAEFHAATHAHPQTRMFAGATINTTDPTIMDGAGDCYFFLGIPWRGGYGRPVSEMPGIGECFSACGASALIHTKTFLEMGGFDERFFCYCEDVDLGFRFRLEGQNCIFWPAAKVYHFGSGTTSVASPFSVRHGTRNRLWTFVKNMPPLGLFFFLPLHLALTAALLVRAAMVGRAGPTYAGLKEGILGIGPVWKDRKEIQRRRKLSTRQVIKSMSWKWSTLRQRKADITPLKTSKKQPF